MLLGKATECGFLSLFITVKDLGGEAEEIFSYPFQ